VERKKLIGLVAVVAACGAGLAIAKTQQAGPSQDAAWHNKQMLALAQLKASDGWQSLPGNLRWRRVTGNGTGKHPSVQDTVTIHYAGTLIDGTEFDSSYSRGEPATFPLGALIPAWQMAVPMMGVGDTIEIASPADLAYGPGRRCCSRSSCWGLRGSRGPHGRFGVLSCWSADERVPGAPPRSAYGVPTCAKLTKLCTTRFIHSILSAILRQR
jgi:FKBP-type peptidyl-prolyl cis-trans isomerase FkpA